MQDSDRLAETAAAANSPYKPLAERLAFERALGFNLLAGLSLAALIAVAGPARALELGDARVTSALGQKLSVEIPYRVHASESLPSACVSLVGGGNSQLPAYTQINGISTRNGTITIAGSRRVLEPLIGLNIRIACSSAPHIVRSYELFVDPAGAAPPPLPQPQPAATRRTATPPPSPRSVRPRSSAVVAGTPIVPGQTYTVVRGDTLSAIAARIDRRDTDLWTAVEQIFTANPTAFDRGSRDLLREGATLEIPLFGARSTPPANAAATPAPAADPADDLALAALAASLAETGTAEPVAPVETAAPPADDALAEPTPATPKPVASDSPFVDGAQAAPPPAEIVSAGTGTPNVTSVPESRTPGWLVALVSALAGTVLLLLWLLAKRTPAARPARAPASPRKPVSTAAVATGGAAAAVAASARTDVTREEPAINEFDVSHQFGADASEQPDVEFVTAAPTAQSALDPATPDEEDPLAISSVDLDIGEALIATGIDIGSASPTHSSGDTSTLTHMKSPTEEDIDTSVTMAEMDILQRDYEAEFTATQQLNADLAAAVADLKRTQDSLADGVVPSDDTLISGAHDTERTAALDDEATAYLEESDSSETAGWDARTVEVASQLTDEVMAYPGAALSEPTQEMPVADEEAGDTVEMPPRAGEDQAPWQSSNDEDDSDGDWPAFHEASKRGGK